MECVRCEVLARFQIELVQFRLLGRPSLRHLLRGRKHHEEDNRDRDARERCNLLGEKIDKAEGEKNGGYRTKAEGDFSVTNLEIQGNAKSPLARLFVAKHEYGKTLECKAPHYTA